VSRPRSGARARLWAALSLAYAMAILAGGTAEVPPGIPGYEDKLAHLVAFAGQYLLVARACAAAGAPRGRQISIAFSAALGLGAGLELWQALLPHRTAELADVVADAAGALAAVVAEEIVLAARRRG
jgi:VanZ family protein